MNNRRRIQPARAAKKKRALQQAHISFGIETIAAF